jgi:hypothetical protein
MAENGLNFLYDRVLYWVRQGRILPPEAPILPPPQPSNTVKNFSWFDFLVDTFETFFCSKYLNQEVGWFPPSFFLESNLFDLPLTLGFEPLLVSDRGDVLFSGSRDGDGCGGGRIGASGGKMRPCRTQ